MMIPGIFAILLNWAKPRHTLMKLVLYKPI